MKGKKIVFAGESLEFDEWMTPGGVSPNRRVEEIVPAAKPGENIDRRIFYQSFGSGSSGNCCYVGTANGGLLIDAGVREDEVEAELKANGVSMEKVKGILLTHDHSDHIKYVYKILRNHKGISLFCTNRVMNGILRHHNVVRRIKDYHVPIFKEIPFKVADFEVTAFEGSHDSTDSMGFSLEYAGRKFVLATDTGVITPRARHYIREARYLVIEANYDLKMLLQGPYPQYLKARIVTSTGHMDNEDTAKFLKEEYQEGMKKIFLCHLSKENNTPEIALRVVKAALEERGLKVGNGDEGAEDRAADVSLMALPRTEATRWFVFR
ncbi:MAG: MBL fold metallo-hydrolase [Muribaculaceae bacterium]|nr:MBL fold metallo-hydrolase [Muribaculaceae bacterium]